MQSSGGQISDIARRNLIFVCGKGGVGKTALSKSLALALSRRERRVLWVEFENPTRPAGELQELTPTLGSLNCEASTAFQEYAGRLIHMPALAKVFLRNKLIQYLSNAAPGIHEIVLTGKVWFERTRYDHVVVDMPATGHGLAMFESTRNFSTLFRGGPIQKDTEAMEATFRDPAQTGLIVVTLPEEMPIQEGLDLDQFLKKLFPDNPASFVVNRKFPELDPSLLQELQAAPASPLARDARDYAIRRSLLERENLRSLDDANIEYLTTEYVPEEDEGKLLDALAGRWEGALR